MTDWRIRILNLNGTQKAVYSNASPGGIVSSIKAELEPSGNCLKASFEGVPAKLNIAPRDFVQIYVDDLVNPLFYGYLSSYVNRESNKVATYNIEGVKALLMRHMVDAFWYRGSPDANGIVTHKAILTALKAQFPAYVSSSFLNSGSTVSGNKVPIIADNLPLGQVIDNIVSSAKDDIYVWGVNGNREVFVKPLGTSELDFTSFEKRMNYGSVNTDNVVTAVRFIFSIPTSFLGDGMTPHKSKDDVATTAGGRKNANSFGDAPIIYDYVDSSASTFGVFTKVVPLVLSDSWMVEWTAGAWATANGVTARSDSNGWETNTGSSTEADLLTVLNGTSGYLRNTEMGEYDAGALLNLQLRKDTGDRIIPGGVIGFTVTYDKKAALAQMGFSKRHFYRSYVSTIPRIVDTPMADYIGYWTTSTTDADSTGTTSTYAFPLRSIKDWLVSPKGVDSDGYPLTSMYRNYFNVLLAPVSGSGIAADDMRITRFRLLTLNTDALDNLAKSFIDVPATYPSEITLSEFPGFYDKGKLNDNSVPIKKISIEISRGAGFSVTYALGNDSDRNNQALNRLFNRDESATLAAVNISRGWG